MRSVEELWKIALDLNFSAAHPESWKNDLAADLNEMTARITYQLSTDGDESDCEWAEASLRVIRRVANLEKINETPRRKISRATA